MIGLFVALLASTSVATGAAAEESDGPPTVPVATTAPPEASDPPSTNPPPTEPTQPPEASEPPETSEPPATTEPPTAEPTEPPAISDPPGATEPPATTEPPAEIETEPPLRRDAGLLTPFASGGFSAGNLISDFNFYNRWAMSEAEIQAFLDARIGACQNGQCLNVLRVDTPTRTWSFGHCSTYTGARGESAARIIYRVQVACGLSAKVILVTLQKEQSLVTSKAPSAGQLRSAMGYGCPDTAACDSTYYGFFNQVFAAARQLTWYSDPGGSFTYIRVGQVNSIRYNPNAACGAGNVFIENRATAALYYYTPYQPNAAALANPYGLGDGCSAYGNRNFWYFYRDWFGDPALTTPIPTVRLSGTDRYATAVEISKDRYPSPGVPVAYVASGGDFPDALSAASAAAVQGGPLLLAAPGGVPTSTEVELRRLRPARIVMVGGTGALGSKVADTLKAIAPVSRIAGADRYETARRIAETVFPSAATAYLATGRDFADALSASAAAGAKGLPVILVDGQAGRADQATLQTLAAMGVTRVKVAGGPGAVSQGVTNSIANRGITVQRLDGPNRYATSVKVVADAFGTAAASAYLATGLSYPDALAGAAAAGRGKAPMYLSLATCMPDVVRDHLLSSSVNSLKMLGGPAALADSAVMMRRC
ncbi:hypothetical protein FLP10_03375 [Agromyces intestinalis]|uniref:Cell wall-binding repeat-containing protein n=1 Tax=Agromyces intestinalis TaxID=2592652 RepID=A0A5C1YDS0_9MICO|nr:cell wall-binding repeat-containing protein [Agromyces intestinalis]QEO13565.1 hypothetical protein FLP10_03375 [Agromyces intestinalis]